MKYQVPIERPSKIVCVGRNYGRHAAELGNAIPDEPIIFAKAPSSMIPMEEKIHIPPNAGRVDYEGEIAIVMGKTASHIDRSQALEHVAAYTLVNDVTARDLQKQDKEKGLPWFRAKSFDTFCPIGPGLVPAGEIPDPQSLTLHLRVNGQERQKGNTADMLFGFDELIAYISRHMTLHVGDIIATGTPAGVGPLQPGDVVEIEVKEIGLLRNGVA
ncbi:MAG: FAA hydrolase family protein [Calditrichaeota bacterium]|nr:MAG: FAA hydrolase family protein [Calditrichota bacterium]